jgi:hypothetical protein
MHATNTAITASAPSSNRRRKPALAWGRRIGLGLLITLAALGFA